MTNKEAILKLAEYRAVDAPEDMHDAIEMAISALEKQEEQQWIPCKNGLPAPESEIQPFYATCRSLVDDRDDWVIEGVYIKYRGWDLPHMVTMGHAEIIAWMPKVGPEPYKEG